MLAIFRNDPQHIARGWIKKLALRITRQAIIATLINEAQPDRRGLIAREARPKVLGMAKVGGEDGCCAIGHDTTSFPNVMRSQRRRQKNILPTPKRMHART